MFGTRWEQAGQSGFEVHIVDKEKDDKRASLIPVDLSPRLLPSAIYFNIQFTCWSSSDFEV